MATVLVIDDDVGTRDTFRQILRLAGYAAVTKASGNEGLRFVRNGNAVDLIVSDLRLPDVTGLDVLRECRTAGCDVPFVVMTAFASTASALAAGRLGAAEYIEKPVSVETLLDVVVAHVRQAVVQVVNEEHAVSASRHATLAMRAILARYADSALSVTSVAHENAISVEHLCRVLKRQTGRAFTTILRDVRVQAARCLLETTNLSVKQIAASTGFGSTTQLDRNFQRAFGIAPTTHRRRRNA